MKVFNEIMTIGKQYVARCDFCEEVFTTGQITGLRDPQTKKEAAAEFLNMGLRKVEHGGCVGDMCAECRKIHSENDNREGLRERL